MNNRILLVIGVIAAVGFGAWFFSSPDETSSPASAGRLIVQVTVPPLDATAQEGEALFNENCAKCHGANAAGIEGDGPPLVHVLYQSGHHGDAAFYRAAKEGVRSHHWPFGNMPPVEGIRDEDLAKIVAYIRILQRANGFN